MKTTVLIADDHQVVIDGLTVLIKNQRDFEIVGTANSGVEVLEFLSNNPPPDLLLMDITMPDMDGLETMESIQQHYPKIKVIMLSMHLSGAFARKLLDLGVKGYLQKDCDKQELLAGLHDVSKGGTYLSHNMTQLLLDERMSHQHEHSEQSSVKISKRETEILQLIIKEHSSREMAEILGISFNTVETHRKHLLNKFGVKTSVGLVREAMRSGVV